jgi:hypothetical protein
MLLALDLGTTCGWALFTADGRLLASGVWSLDQDARRSRFEVFRLRVLSQVEVYKVRRVVFEHVRRHAAATAAHVFGGWLAALDEVQYRTRAELVGLRPQDIHRAAGVEADRSRPPKGASKAERRRASAARRKDNKAAVLAAARARWGFMVRDDNEADALFVGLAAMAKGAGL